MTAEKYLNDAKIILGEDSYGNNVMIDDDLATFEAVIEVMKQYASEIAVEFATQIDDTYDEGTSFEERLKRWGDIFDKWKSKEDK